MTPRERRARHAFDILGEPRVLAFLRAIRDKSPSLASRYINEHLDARKTLEGIFFNGDHLGYSLSASPRAPQIFEVHFGYSPSAFVGDGGQWEVEFDESGSVVRTTNKGFWIS